MKLDNVVFINDYIDAQCAKEFISDVLEISSNPLNGGVIFVLFNSEGGNIDDALAIRDFMDLVDTKFIGINIGKCYSASVQIFLNCDARFALKNSKFFVHEFLLSLEQSSLSKVGTSIKECKDSFKDEVKFFSEKTGLPVSKCTKMIKDETRITAEKAKEINLVNDILTSLDFKDLKI